MNINFPNVIFYQNERTDFRNEEIMNCFEKMTFDEVLKLRINDLYFLTIDFVPKTACYSTFLVKAISKFENHVSIENQFGTGKRVQRDDINLYKIKDINHFKKLINENPKSTRSSGIEGTYRFSNV